MGTVVTLLDTTSYSGWYKISTSSLTGYVSSTYISLGATQSTGTASISTTSKSMEQYKTLYLYGTVGGSTSGTVWTSSNTSVATVNGGYVYAKSTGTATITVSNSAGTSSASCTVTVTEPEAVRFVYSDPNTPSAGESFNLVAVTDTTRSQVKFVIDGKAYECSSYTTETATSNTVRIFKQSVSLSSTGSYTVNAYSRASSSSAWSTDYATNSLRVISTSSYTDTTTDSRAASSKIIAVIANFEGYASEVYPDTLAGNIPTVGYGYVVSKNETFYNFLTKTEAMAMLADTVNKDGYATAVEKFRSNNNIKMSQSQFDALVSFVYNVGTGVLSSSYDTFKVLLNASSNAGATNNTNLAGTINISSAKLYSSAGTSNPTGNTLSSGSAVTVSQIVRENGNVDNLWYYVSNGSVSGWVRGGYVKLSSPGTCDLEYIDEQFFGSKLLEWKNASGVSIYGLLYRRLGEAKIFCYANYDDAYSSSSNYKKNVGFDVPSGMTLS